MFTHFDAILLLYLVLNSACLDGDVLLYDGSVLSTSLREGTVLVCYNNTYGTVCDDRWDSIEASIVCGKLGFQNQGKIFAWYCILSQIILLLSFEVQTLYIS